MLTGAVVTAVLLILAFVLGAILSRQFLGLAARILTAIPAKSARFFTRATLDELVREERAPREVYGYLNTGGGLDIYLFAGRIRMVGPMPIPPVYLTELWSFR